MRKVLHISDLHFGRVDDRLVDAIVQMVKRCPPHVVAVSGDLTQRARPAEFRAAREFLDALPAPKIVVPGNHDVPLHNVIARLWRPLRRFRDIVGEDIEPAYVDEHIAVVGVNTARSLVLKGGRINRYQIKRVRDLMCSLPRECVRVLVTHHPLDLPHGRRRGNCAYRAPLAMEELRTCAPDVLLAGHTHVHGVGRVAERYELAGHTALLVQAGTATSTRARGAPNSFNMIHVEPTEIGVEHFTWVEEKQGFHADSLLRFARNRVA